MQFFLPKLFGGTPPGTPQNGALKKYNFLRAQARALVFFLYQQILNRQIFWRNLGVPSPREPPTWTPQNQFFERLKPLCQCFLMSVDI